jgi:hypothetical protein
MASHATLKVLTANRLSDGRVVYLGETGWTVAIEEARLIATPDEVSGAEAEGARAVADRMVVEPYLIDVETETGGILPASLRERIRARGPSTGHSRGAAA